MYCNSVQWYTFLLPQNWNQTFPLGSFHLECSDPIFGSSWAWRNLLLCTGFVMIDCLASYSLLKFAKIPREQKGGKSIFWKESINSIYGGFCYNATFFLNYFTFYLIRFGSLLRNRSFDFKILLD